MIHGENTQEQLDVAKTLTPDPYVSFFEINLNPTSTMPVILRLSQYPNVTWNGKSWESYPIQLTGEATSSAGDFNRPKLSLANYFAVFSSYLAKGLIQRGRVTRYKVLRKDVENGIVNYAKAQWDISKVDTLTKELVTLELRSPGDCHNYNLPARQYIGPEFPFVKIN